MGLSLNGTVITIVTLAVSLVLIGSLLAPVANDVMQTLEHETGGVPDFEDGASWASLVGVVVLFAIMGLVIVAVNNYTKSK